MDIRVNAKTILKVLAVWFHNTNQRLPTRKAFIIDAAFAALTDFYWKIRKEPQGISKNNWKWFFFKLRVWLMSMIQERENEKFKFQPSQLSDCAWSDAIACIYQSQCFISQVFSKPLGENQH